MKFTKYLQISLVILFLGLIFFAVKQRDQIKQLKHQIEVVDNNAAALSDSLDYYKDSNGLLNAEKLALQLRSQDLEDSLEYERNKEPITVIKYKVKIVEKPVPEPYLVYDTASHSSQIVWEDQKNYGLSSFAFKALIAYTVQDSTLSLGSSSLTFEQNLWCRASLLYGKQDDKLYVNLATDYPGVVFNDAQGILIEDSESLNKLKYKSRQTWGLGLHFGYGLTEKGPAVYVGAGFVYMPRWLQF